MDSRYGRRGGKSELPSLGCGGQGRELSGNCDGKKGSGFIEQRDYHLYDDRKSQAARLIY